LLGRYTSPMGEAAMKELVRRGAYYRIYNPGLHRVSGSISRHEGGVPAPTVSYPFVKSSLSPTAGGTTRGARITTPDARGDDNIVWAANLGEMGNLEELAISPQCLLSAIGDYDSWIVSFEDVLSDEFRAELPSCSLPFLTMTRLRRVNLLRGLDETTVLPLYQGLAGRLAAATQLTSLACPLCDDTDPLRYLTALEELTFSPLREEQTRCLQFLTRLRSLQLRMDMIGRSLFKDYDPIDTLDLSRLSLLEDLVCELRVENEISLHAGCKLRSFQGTVHSEEWLARQTALEALYDDDFHHPSNGVLANLGRLRALLLPAPTEVLNLGHLYLTRLDVSCGLENLAEPLSLLTTLRQINFLGSEGNQSLLGNPITLPVSLERLTTIVPHDNWGQLTRLHSLKINLREDADYTQLSRLEALTKLDTLAFRYMEANAQPELRYFPPNLRVLRVAYTPEITQLTLLRELTVLGPPLTALAALAALPSLRYMRVLLGVYGSSNNFPYDSDNDLPYDSYREQLLSLATQHGLEVSLRYPLKERN